MVETPRVQGVRRGVTRLGLSIAGGGLTGALLSRWGVPHLGVVAGWNAGALIYTAMGWGHILAADAARTKRHAAAEDPGRTLVSVVVLAASLFSLFATLVVLRDVRHTSPRAGDLVIGLCLLAIALTWVVTHTSYSLRYAHLHYRDERQGLGLEFPGKAAPCYFDFAYFSFTIGMCFQVSDVGVSSPTIRRAVLGHALLSFIYNTTIVALSLNLVFALLN
jgi:uncharacterized membrane protein